MVLRKYTPVSSLTDEGHFDLLVKVYQPTPTVPDGGKMTRWLDSLAINSVVEMSGPKGGLNYRGGGVFDITQGEFTETRKVKRIGMVAGGTGITPCYQLIQYIATHPEEKVELFLIYGNRTENDILLKRSLDYYVRTAGLKLFYILDTPPQTWTGGAGYVTQEILETHLPAPGPDVFIVHCGPPPMNISVRKSLQAIGHLPQAIFKF